MRKRKNSQPQIEAQELHCHNCDRYVQFNLDLSLNGNHVLRCPNCGHEHCRVVMDGKITGERWDQRNGLTYTVRTYAYTITSTFVSSTSSSYYLYNSWMNATTSAT